MFVCCECCVCLSGTGLCDGLITRPEESYRLWCVLVSDLVTSRLRRLKLIKGCKCRIEEENFFRQSVIKAVQGLNPFKNWDYDL
jgi:hypothetical protein